MLSQSIKPDGWILNSSLLFLLFFPPFSKQASSASCLSKFHQFSFRMSHLFFLKRRNPSLKRAKYFPFYLFTAADQTLTHDDSELVGKWNLWKIHRHDCNELSCGRKYAWLQNAREQGIVTYSFCPQLDVLVFYYYHHGWSFSQFLKSVGRNFWNALQPCDFQFFTFSFYLFHRCRVL